MKRFDVQVLRTERVQLLVEADDEEQAVALALNGNFLEEDKHEYFDTEVENVKEHE